MKTTTLFFRKPWPGGNFSIEASFRQMMAVFHRDSDLSIRAHTVIIHSKGLLPRLKILWELWRNRTAVNHITGDIHFGVLALPRRRTVLTIHDCGFLRHPNPLFRQILLWFWLRIPVWWVSKVVVVSEATRADVLRYSGCSPKKIQVIPTIIRDHFSFVPSTFNSQKPRVLHIGTAPNKNLERHILALSGLPVHLHIIGKISDRHRDMLRENQIDYHNEWGLTDAAVKAAYESCDLLLFASTFEGFGMPILEAQSVGRPVITSRCSSMPEVAGEAACYVNPTEVDSIRAGIVKVMEDARYREKLIHAGLENVRRFSPETVAAAYQTIYRSLCQPNNRTGPVKTGQNTTSL